mmetsp:Transcript_27330/g.47174  ORF Transcript_27330/g.47174 Transcript_27330/m.47174 type:complete len:237 (-) Transcript_27330:821-1531(-)
MADCLLHGPVLSSRFGWFASCVYYIVGSKADDHEQRGCRERSFIISSSQTLILAQRRRPNRPAKRTSSTGGIHVTRHTCKYRDSRVALLFSRRSHNGRQSVSSSVFEVMIKCTCLSRAPERGTTGALEQTLELVATSTPVLHLWFGQLSGATRSLVPKKSACCGSIPTASLRLVSDGRAKTSLRRVSYPRGQSSVRCLRPGEVLKKCLARASACSLSPASQRWMRDGKVGKGPGQG